MSNANPENLKIVKEHGQQGVLFRIAGGGETAFVASSDANVYALAMMQDKLEPQPLSGHTSYVTGLVETAHGLVSGSYDRKLIWWNTETREPIRTIDAAHAKWIRNLAVSPDGQFVASVADDMVCRIWNAADGSLKHELKGHEAITPNHYPSMLFCCAFSADGGKLATADKVGHVVVWDVASGKQLAAVEAPTMYTWDPKQRIHSIGGIRSLAFSPDGKLLATGGMGQVGNIDHLGALARVEVFDWEKQERTHEFAGDEYKGLVERLYFQPEGKWLLGAGGDNGGFIKFFDLASGKLIKQDKAPMHVHDFAVNEAADTIYAVGHGRMVVWSIGG